MEVCLAGCKCSFLGFGGFYFVNRCLISFDQLLLCVFESSSSCIEYSLRSRIEVVRFSTKAT
jgi:hypothetical protein